MPMYIVNLYDTDDMQTRTKEFFAQGDSSAIRIAERYRKESMAPDYTEVHSVINRKTGRTIFSSL